MKKYNFKELQDLLNPIYSEGNLNTVLEDIEYDSRCIFPKTCFVAIKGENFDGNTFIPEAIDKGVSALIVSSEFYEQRENKYRNIFVKIKNSKVPYLVVKDTQRAISIASAFVYEYPSSKLSLIGITGTNGKTSITYIIEKILKETKNYIPAIIGSTMYRYPQKAITNIEYTTPKSLYLERLLSQMYEAGVTHVALEVSSHGIKMHRVRDLDFELAIFTNLSRDHMDYHKTIEDYFETKKELFTDILLRSKKEKKFAIINIDDHYGKQLFNTIKHIPELRVISYGFSFDADYRVSEYELKDEYSTFKLLSKYKSYKFKIHLSGKHNIYNAVASISAMLEAYNIPIELIHKALDDKNFVIPGRLDKITGYNIFIDYAHTDDALLNVLNALKETYPDKRIITVFGAGGDRDKGKRPKMGSVVSELSDYAIVTSDNPRTEDPKQIVDSIIAGMKHKNYTVVLDREEAIKYATKIFNKDKDVLLIAGKGHETYQIIGTTKTHFDDKEIVKKYITENISRLSHA